MKLDFIEIKNVILKDTSVYQTAPETPIRFCFVGPRGVGKTSLLCSMYQQIKKNNVDGVYIDIHSAEGAATSEILNDSLQDMLEMIEETPKGELAALEPSLKGSQDAITHSFVGVQKVKDNQLIKLTPYKQFRFDFKFTDMPGQWYDLNENNDHKEDAKQYLENSVVSFLAVDTPALVKGPATCQRNNRVAVIEEWYRNAAAKLGANKHTVIIVLSRCERYWSQKKLMLEKLKEVYGALIDSLKQDGIEVYVTWIQTLGAIEFSHYEKSREDDGTRIDHARFLRCGDEYAPVNCCTPLQLALAKGLTRAADAIDPGVWAKLGFGIKALAKDAATAMAHELEEKIHESDVNTYKTL